VGISSLLLALNNAGSEKVFVAGPRGLDAYIEKNVDLVLGRYKTFPVATTCEVTSPSVGVANASNADCWWQVYDDEFILVHAKYVDLQRAKESIKDDDDDDESSAEGSESSSSSPPSSSSEDESSTSDKEEDTSQYYKEGKEEDTSRYYKEGNSSKSLSVAYIFTCKGTEVQFAILPPDLDMSSPLIPASLHPLPEVVSRHAQSRASSGRANCVFSLIAFLSPQAARSSKDEMKRENVHEDLRAISQSFVATVHSDDGFWDEGILVRASNQARELHQVLPFAFATNNLPNINGDSQLTTGLESDYDDVGMALKSCTSMIIWHGQHDNPGINAVVDRRRRIMSRILEKKGASITKHCSSNGNDGANGCEERRDDSLDSEVAELSRIYSGGLVEEVATEVVDRNEISLNDVDHDDDSHDECSDDSEESSKSCKEAVAGASIRYGLRAGLDPHVAHLLVLGTGCASPSPLRGSSGYGILLPFYSSFDSQNGVQRLCLAGLLECGEGSLLALRRHLPSTDVHSGQSLDDWLCQIRFIWISHAHLDHYSELPLVIRAIADAGGRRDECRCWKVGQTPAAPAWAAHVRRPSQVGASLWCGKCSFPPIVIAPAKVLKFLEASLACGRTTSSASRKRKHDPICDTSRFCSRLYFGVSNQDFDRSPFASTLREMFFNIELPLSASSFYRPFASLQSVSVTHCPQAFAVILGLRVPNNNKPLFLVYSGDTRPSQSLVQACRCAVAAAGDGTRIDMLIHETTFDDDDEGKQNAIAKRHSTVLEAIEVARQTKARCCLFTHFSQRYPNLPESASTKVAPGSLPVKREYELEVCAAVDGMVLPLKDLQDILRYLPRCCERLCNP